MRSNVFKIAVRENGEILLYTYDMCEVLSRQQLGIHTKPHSIEDFMADVRREVEGAWDRLKDQPEEEKWPGEDRFLSRFSGS